MKMDLKEKNKEKNAFNLSKVSLFEKRREYRHFLAGILARTTSLLVTAPFDTVKTRLQYQGSRHLSRKYRYSEVFKDIRREEGISSLWKGAVPRLLFSAPAAATMFLFYEKLKIHNGKGQKQKQKEKIVTDTWERWSRSFATGVFFRMLGTACRTPFDVVKQQLQLSPTYLHSEKSGNSVIFFFRTLSTSEGWLHLWHGFSSACIRDLTSTFFYFGAYEFAEIVQKRFSARKLDVNEEKGKGKGKNVPLSYCHQHHHVVEPYVIRRTLISGAFAGIVSCILTIPLDVVKTRIQTNSLIGAPGCVNHGYTGFKRTVQSIYEKEGFRGFHSGLLARLVYVVPTTSLSFGTYEVYKRILSNFSQKKKSGI